VLVLCLFNYLTHGLLTCIVMFSTCVYLCCLVYICVNLCISVLFILCCLLFCVHSSCYCSLFLLLCIVLDALFIVIVTSHRYCLIYTLISGPGSSVGIASGYGLDGPGIESRWGRDFSHTSRPAMEPTQAPVQWVPGLSRR
jgi:hypothetical protein